MQDAGWLNWLTSSRVKKADGLVAMVSLKVQEFTSGTCRRQTSLWSPSSNFRSLDRNDLAISIRSALKACVLVSAGPTQAPSSGRENGQKEEEDSLYASSKLPDDKIKII